MAQGDSNPLSEIVRTIDGVKARGRTKLVALDGRGGSGKSTLARMLAAEIPGSQIIQLDSFPCRADESPFHALGTQTGISVRRVLDEAIVPLQRGEPARYRQTSWWALQCGDAEKLLEAVPGGTVIIEGCYALRPELRQHYDFSIWVERDVAEALADALARDGGERDRAVWEHVYIPNESRYIESERPQERADMVVRNKGRAFRVERLGCASSG